MAERRVVTEIAGLVCKIMTVPKSPVSDREPIMVIESMKMEIPILSPQSGTVIAVLVREGDNVGEGQEVAILET